MVIADKDIHLKIGIPKLMDLEKLINLEILIL